MAVHRMDLLVASHQNQLLREAQEQRLATASHRIPREGGRHSGGIHLAPFRYAIHVALHDARSHHLHRHHVGHRA